MPVIQELFEAEEVFKKLTRTPVIINDLPNSTNENREFIENIIRTTYSSDMVSTLPQCMCGYLKGEFSRSLLCTKCNTRVSSAIEDVVEPTVWFRQPVGVAKIMLPIVWCMLEQRFNKKNFNIIRWLTDTSYSAKISKPDFVYKIESLGIKRGYNYFVENFFFIIESLLKINVFKNKTEDEDYLWMLLTTYKNNLFTTHLPIVNKLLLIIEKTRFATYIDTSVPAAIDAIEMMVSIDKDFRDQSSITKQNRTARALYQLSCKFFDEYFGRIMAKKPGMFRHNVAGGRFDFTARCVITSITDKHRYDSIEIPWCVGLVIFRPHLVNKLINKYKLGLNEIDKLLVEHIAVYHPLLDQCLKELLAETKHGKYPVIFNRFPSLLQGSIQLVYIDKIKTNINDLTIGCSTLIIKAPNADYDGDQMSICLSLDDAMADMWRYLAPRYNIFGMESPMESSNAISIPKPIIATISSWLEAGDE